MSYAPGETEVLTRQALDIDANPPVSTPRVHIDAEVSCTAAVFARASLEKTIQDLEELEGGGREALWVTWTLRTIAHVLDEAIEGTQR